MALPYQPHWYGKEHCKRYYLFTNLENDRSCSYKKVVSTKSKFIDLKMILEYAYPTGITVK